MDNYFSSPLLKVGDKIKVVQPVESKFSRWWKSMISVMYDPNIQPEVGDEYEIVAYQKNNEVYKNKALLGDYTIKCLNRKLPVFDADQNSTQPYVFWIDELIRKNKICKIKND